MRAAAVGLIAGWIALASAADAPRYLPGIDAFHGEWYGKQLQALQESSLCCDSTDRGRVIRFVWLRSFHHPVVIRLNESTKGSWSLVTKVGSGAGGYDPRHGIVGTATDAQRSPGDRDTHVVQSDVLVLKHGEFDAVGFNHELPARPGQ